MVSAFLLINIEEGTESKTLESFKAFPEIVEANNIYGLFNIIARIDTGTIKELKDAISYKINRLEMVKSILSLKILDTID